MIFNTVEYGIFLLSVFVAFWLNVGAKHRWAALLVLGAWCGYLFVRNSGGGPLTTEDVAVGLLGVPTSVIWATLFGLGCAWLGAVVMRFSNTRTILLLVVSYVFYASWNPTLLVLIWFSSSLDYYLGRRLSRDKKPWRRACLLALSIGTNMGLLLFFKYAGFIYENIVELCAMLDWSAPPPVFVFGFGAGLNSDTTSLDRFALDMRDIILPVGISFYTFQTMSYIIDVFRKQVSPARSYFEYLLYVSFFPQLVAGPIVRAKDFLPQFRQLPSVDAMQGSAAVWLILGGLFKKIMIADYLAVNLVDRVFENPVFYSSWEILIGVYAYALQIYCDFSGYSDIAIGSALLLGFRININFNSPYQALDLQDFWRRWHISLSTWFRDYLYIPLGGNRHGVFRTYFNLWVVMLLCALWHGASWTFIAWGTLHGLGLVAVRIWYKAHLGDKLVLGTAAALKPVARRARGDRSTRWSRWLRLRYARRARWIAGRGAEARAALPTPFAANLFSGLVTFHFVCLAWIFFRSESFENAGQVFSGLTAFEWGTANLSWGICATLILGYVMHVQTSDTKRDLRDLFTSLPAYCQGIVIFLFLMLFYITAQQKEQPFIYFQF